jgi:hypothetical protein
MSVSRDSLQFPSVAGREVEARFDGGDVTSDAGVLLLRQADKRLGLTASLSGAVSDRRQQSKVRHGMEQMVQERVYAIACGYEDANDLDRLREDAALKTACGFRPTRRGVLAAQPTISRMENAVSKKDLLRMAIALAEAVVRQLPRKTRCVVLDIDATDDPCHGQQQFEIFNAYYDEHCYLPLHLYVTGSDGRQRLLGALLRPGNASYRTGLFGMLRLAIRILRARFPGVRITLRADAGFGYGDVLAFCERHGLLYAIGISVNKRLTTLSTPIQMDCAIKHGWEGDGCREYGEFEYKAKSWSHARRVVVKVEVTQGKLNPRFVVTNLQRTPARLYAFYCERGDRENRIKELKLDMFSGRTSCHRFLANQMRLVLHSAAYALMQALQAAAAGTPWGNAQAATLRSRLLKVGGRVIETCRRIWFHLPSSFPYREAWHRIHRGLAAEA